MIQWALDNPLAAVIAVIDFFMWCAILRMHLTIRWHNEATEQAAERKKRLDREKLKGPSAEVLRARREVRARSQA